MDLSLFGVSQVLVDLFHMGALLSTPSSSSRPEVRVQGPRRTNFHRFQFPANFSPSRLPIRTLFPGPASVFLDQPPRTLPGRTGSGWFPSWTVIFPARLFLGLIQPMNPGLEAPESVVMTIKPDPAKTIFWSRLSTALHSNGKKEKPQRGKQPSEEEQSENPPQENRLKV